MGIFTRCVAHGLAAKNSQGQGHHRCTAKCLDATGNVAEFVKLSQPLPLCSIWAFPPKPREGDNSWVYISLLHTQPSGRQQQGRASKQVSTLPETWTEEEQRSSRCHCVSESHPPRAIASRPGCWPRAHLPLRSIPGPCPREKLRYFSFPLSVPSSVFANGCVPSVVVAFAGETQPLGSRNPVSSLCPSGLQAAAASCSYSPHDLTVASVASQLHHHLCEQCPRLNPKFKYLE